jgi:hypothetical protein
LAHGIVPALLDNFAFWCIFQKMKESVRSYLSFSRTQRMGIIVLGGILLVLLGIRAGMHYFVKPEPAKNEQELHAAWEQFKSEQDQLRKKAAGPVNINTADSAALVALTGIGPKTAQKILLYRQSKGTIANMKQLNSIQHFSEGVSQQLEAEIVFSDSAIVDK